MMCLIDFIVRANTLAELRSVQAIHDKMSIIHNSVFFIAFALFDFVALNNAGCINQNTFKISCLELKNHHGLFVIQTVSFR